MRGRPKNPTNVLELSGAFKKNPSRALSRDSFPLTRLGRPPAHWILPNNDPGFARGQELKKIWGEIHGLAPWLTSSSRFLLEDACVLRHKARFGLIKPGELNQLRLIGNALGLDGRARLTEPEQRKAREVIDPRDAFAARRSGMSTDMPPA
jgi:hypothetical protein